MANLVILTGNVGKDPELRHAKNDTPFATCSLATSRFYRDANGDRHDETTWHDLILWGPSAENLVKHVEKGTRVMVEGRLEYRQDEENGVKRQWASIRVKNWEVQARRKGSDQAGTADEPEEPTAEDQEEAAE